MDGRMMVRVFGNDREMKRYPRLSTYVIIMEAGIRSGPNSVCTGRPNNGQKYMSGDYHRQKAKALYMVPFSKPYVISALNFALSEQKTILW